ncbi:tat pathway signal sequence [Actinophytocola glycyrrhizae]|uniref:Tat pathway signal sequence n=1 Tax=Actinophytocola glycyrrhizae TaxID=2044873 RepID=A0ABV9SBT1_9PSEU
MSGHTPGSAECPLPDAGFDCDFQRRIVAVQEYLADRPGTTGVVLHDQQTGAVWHNDHATDPTWTASTIKLAMVVDLFTRDRAGEITLTADDRALIEAMLNSSDNDAADALWYRYAGADHMSFNENFPAYGMTSLVPQKGYTEFYPYWGFQKCTPEDLDRLIHHVLTDLPEPDRSYILGEMRSVAPNQQWGVWGAGADAAPGNKNGWSEEDGGWVMNSVGFVGPGERYTLAEMNNLGGEGGYDVGRETVTHVAELLFAGRF